jgi:hypothetical protein
VELQAMRTRARRPNASLEVQEWSILNNEKGGATWEPSSVGAAWSAASATRWVCAAGVERIFHWETGTAVRNRTGDGRRVNFYEQWSWNMALLELFLGGLPRFATFDLVPGAGAGAGALNGTVAVIESAKGGGELLLLVAALGPDRHSPFRTALQWNASAGALRDCGGGGGGGGGGGRSSGSRSSAVEVHQYRMDSSASVVETIVAELRGQPGMLLHDDGLPYDIGRLLTPAGLAYVQRPENLDRYWELQRKGFQPAPFEGRSGWGVVSSSGPSGAEEFQLHFEVTAPSVTVLVARCSTR